MQAPGASRSSTTTPPAPLAAATTTIPPARPERRTHNAPNRDRHRRRGAQAGEPVVFMPGFRGPDAAGSLDGGAQALRIRSRIEELTRSDGMVPGPAKAPSSSGNTSGSIVAIFSPKKVRRAEPVAPNRRLASLRPESSETLEAGRVRMSRCRSACEAWSSKDLGTWSRGPFRCPRSPTTTGSCE